MASYRAVLLAVVCMAVLVARPSSAAGSSDIVFNPDTFNVLLFDPVPLTSTFTPVKVAKFIVTGVADEKEILNMKAVRNCDGTPLLMKVALISYFNLGNGKFEVSWSMQLSRTAGSCLDDNHQCSLQFVKDDAAKTLVSSWRVFGRVRGTDTTKPTFVSPPTNDSAAIKMECNAPLVKPTVSDNCGQPLMSLVYTKVSRVPVSGDKCRMVQRGTWKATDKSGNANVLSMTYDEEDTKAPVFLSRYCDNKYTVCVIVPESLYKYYRIVPVSNTIFNGCFQDDCTPSAQLGHMLTCGSCSLLRSASNPARPVATCLTNDDGTPYHVHTGVKITVESVPDAPITCELSRWTTDTCGLVSAELKPRVVFFKGLTPPAGVVCSKTVQMQMIPG